MRGNPNLRPESVHPFHRSAVITDDSYPGGSNDIEQQIEQQIEQLDDGQPYLAPQPQTFQLEVGSADLDSSSWSRPQADDGSVPSSTTAGTWVHDSCVRREQVLAEIEDLTEMLKAKLVRYSALLANRRSAEVGERLNENAVLWIQDAVEDIAATALGIEVASRELSRREES